MRSPPALAAVAGVTHRLAVLLKAGVPPASAWAYVAEDAPGVAAYVAEDAPGVAAAVVAGNPARVVDSITSAAADLPVLEGDAWRGLAAAWSVATDAGAPLASSLRDYASSMRDLAQVQRDVAVALAGPVATARVVMALPLVGLLFGAALGFDTFGVLFGTPIGIVCLVTSALLVGVALWWNRRLVASAQPREATPGLHCELMAIAVSGGGSTERARATVSAALARCGITGEDSQVDAVLALSSRAGVPAAELLRSEGDEQRREARASAQERAAGLAVRLMLPLGLCVLPAFIAVGVVPLVMSVISSTIGSF